MLVEQITIWPEIFIEFVFFPIRQCYTNTNIQKWTKKKWVPVFPIYLQPNVEIEQGGGSND